MRRRGRPTCRASARCTRCSSPTPTRSLAGYTTDARPRARSTCSTTSRAGSRSGTATAGQLARGARSRRPSPARSASAALHDPLVADDPLAERLLAQLHRLPDARLAATSASTGSDEREMLKARPRFFDGRGMRVEQHFATSKDGTRVPYFVVWPAGREGRRPQPDAALRLRRLRGLAEARATRAASAAPGSSAAACYVVANIRGGGEFGPAWHQAALQARTGSAAYDDFIAVAEDLIARRITSAAPPRHPGRQQRRAAGGRDAARSGPSCSARSSARCRCSTCGATTSCWPARRGWPSTATPTSPRNGRASRSYSPYQNVRAGHEATRACCSPPRTRDDRVHPGHARKMAARMLEQGHDVLYYENIEGGHGGAADNDQRAAHAGAGVQLLVAATAGMSAASSVLHNDVPGASRPRCRVSSASRRTA